MVRIKHRYLLAHILYPDPADPKAQPPRKFIESALPDVVQFHRPSPDDLTPQLLARTIRDQVLLLYGDYGLGLVSSSLKSNLQFPPVLRSFINARRSHVSLTSNVHRHNSMLARTLPPRMGSFVILDTFTQDVETGTTESMRDTGG